MDAMNGLRDIRCGEMFYLSARAEMFAEQFVWLCDNRLERANYQRLTRCATRYSLDSTNQIVTKNEKC